LGLEVDVDVDVESERLQSSFEAAPRDLQGEFSVPPLPEARGNRAVRAAALIQQMSGLTTALAQDRLPHARRQGPHRSGEVA